ncbi:MAG: alpha-glucan family phosphorylase [Candidatus Lokiarchaeota archaeon]|nr:alpha-glucan family phosphorylase [Candidatus Lokiarchaeota archaeon]
MVIKKNRKIAYFSMEIAMDSDIPTYSGGLGVLAGDTVRSAADLEIPLVAITLCYDKGYFYQQISPEGYQVEKEVRWEFSKEFEPVPKIIEIKIQGKPVKVGAWKYSVIGKTGWEIPVYLLDTEVPQADGMEWAKNFTHVLYDATPFQRCVQETLLGIAGPKLLDELGYSGLNTYHLNEGHASFLTLYLLKKLKDEEEVKKRCIFTTHTPVPAGHDKFEYSLIQDVLRDYVPPNIKDYAGEDKLNMTKLAIHFTRYVNAVAQMHGKVSREMFPGVEIDAITNGVHSRFWTNEYLAELLDEFTNEGTPITESWFDKVWKIDPDDIWEAHEKAKYDLIDYQKSHSSTLFEEEILTIGFARRVTGYKRPTLIFNNLEELARIAKNKIQFIFAGKAHPRDDQGKGFIKEIHDKADELWHSYRIKVCFLGHYDMDLAKMMVSGCDVWLNNPRRYREASGTSGMKASHNGVLNLSILDGWWIEGYQMDPKAGWAIGPAPGESGADENNDDLAAKRIYKLLEEKVVPIFYYNRNEWVDRMRHAVGLGKFFNTNRMVSEYAKRAWNLEESPRWISRVNL